MKTDVAVIGPGNWGSSLVAALRHAHIPLREVIAQTRRTSMTTLESARLDVGILWLCVPDDAIANLAVAIAQHRRQQGHTLRGQLVVHSSGALTVASLEAVCKAGASVASVHPVMSFPTRKVVSLQNVLFGVEVQQPAVKRKLYGLIRKIGGKPFSIDSAKKALYHAAGTLAFTVVGKRTHSSYDHSTNGRPYRRRGPEVSWSARQATSRNVFVQGQAKSFSGPFARGDVTTISLHLRALAEHPILTDVYRSLASNAIETLPVQRQKELSSLFK